MAELAGLGIQLRLDGDALRFTAPTGAMTPAIRARLQAAKPAVIERLRRDAAAPLPASVSQRRFWQLQRLDPDWAFYNVPFLFRLSGKVDAAVLRRALDAIVCRHESLRTTLHDRDGGLVQIVAPAGSADWLEADAPEPRALDLLREDMLRPYDLANGRMLRGALVRVGEDAYLFQVCLHNVCFDMASLLVILDEISAIYASGGESRLPAPVQYSEYVRWQATRLASGADRRRAYWENWLEKGEPPAWSWPVRAQPPARSGFDSLPTWTRLPADQNACLQAFCRAHGVTPYIAVLTAYLLATRRLTGCADITIGTTYSDRDDARFATMIGASIVVPALRIDMTDDPGIGTLLLRVRDVVAAALTHQDLPIEEVVERKAKGPLFRLVCTAFPQTPHGRLRLPGISAAWAEEWWNPISRPTLYLVVWETPRAGGASLTCHMMHRQDVWDEAMAGDMIRAFEASLRGMASG